jgi:hypothetical protein
MSLYGNVPGRMEYIQKLFLNAGNEIAAITNVREMITHLDTEAPEFRSIAYEGASFEIGWRDLKNTQGLNQWIEFREACAGQHSFHIDIGLGWAFAKTELWPTPFFSSVNEVVKRMLFDGIGYYYALFKGRGTIKAKTIPQAITDEGLNGFDQGVGRRLWYMAKGNINEVVDLVSDFPANRHSSLFQGIGIACGYVGGSREEDLRQLIEVSGLYHKQLQAGIILAVISRIASNTLNEDIDRACHIICNKSVSEIKILIPEAPTNFFYLYKTRPADNWLSQLESGLLQID